ILEEFLENNIIKKIKTIHIIMLLFFLINIFFLTSFPFVHSDEAWLSGLSRHILEKQELAVTEPFFDLYPRHPHAIKIFFHTIQIIFIKLMGYHIFTFRFISLISGTFSLYIFYLIAKNITKSNTQAIFAVIILGIDIQFIYASHFARQEILLLIIQLLALNYYLKIEKKKSAKSDILLGMILGTGIGLHPNSFLIALPFILIYSYNVFFKKIFKISRLITLISVLALIALLFISISLSFNSNFINDYANYGESLGVSNSIVNKIKSFDDFYQKLFYRVSGTYYTPNIKFQFSIFALSLFFTFIRLILCKINKSTNCLISTKNLFTRHINRLNTLNYNSYTKILLLMFIGINLGYVIIGRYNQTGILFIFPISYLLVITHLSSLRRKKITYILIIVIIAISAYNTSSTILKESHYNYDNYLSEIESVVDKNDKVLANINAEYYFNNGSLLDYRNLAYLKENKLSFSEYIKSNEIEYIIYPEEMDFIYNTRPIWNILYGNLYPFYKDMKDFLHNDCTLVYSFTNKSYGMRINKYIGKKNWSIKIYQVKN
ncbi:MAG: ArnT family glycosyltransferase, partial [bacterium]